MHVILSLLVTWNPDLVDLTMENLVLRSFNLFNNYILFFKKNTYNYF